jgi:hypothetical protein
MDGAGIAPLPRRPGLPSVRQPGSELSAIPVGGATRTRYRPPRASARRQCHTTSVPGRVVIRRCRFGGFSNHAKAEVHIDTPQARAPSARHPFSRRSWRFRSSCLVLANGRAGVCRSGPDRLTESRISTPTREMSSGSRARRAGSFTGRLVSLRVRTISAPRAAFAATCRRRPVSRRESNSGANRLVALHSARRTAAISPREAARPGVRVPRIRVAAEGARVPRPGRPSTL